MQQITKSTSASIALLLILALGTLFFRIGSLPLSGNDEPRYARVAEEMYESGSWVTPTLEHKPWLEKPPLYYWTTIPFDALIHSRETAARLSPALSALFAALAIFWLGRKLRNRLSGLIGAAVLLTSLGFSIGGRTAATDLPFTCCLTLGLSILAAAVKKDPGTAKVLAAYVFLGLAVLGKGPVAVILAAGIGLLYWYFNEHGNILARWRIMRGLLVLLLVSVPWFLLAFEENGYAFITTFFVNHNLARYVTEIHHHAQPFYFYLPVLLLLLFPWSGWLAFAINKSPLREIRRWRNWDPGMLFLGGWVLVPLFFFSLSESKLAGYILPSLPPLSLILGIRIAAWMENPAGRKVLRISTILTLVLSAIMAAAAPIYFLKFLGGNLQTGLALSIAFLVPALFTVYFGFRNQCGKAITATALQGLLVILVAVQFAGPVLANNLSARGLARLALEEKLPDEPIVTFGITNHSLNYYTGYTIQGEIDDPAELESLLQAHPHLLVVTEEPEMRKLDSAGSYSIELLGKQGDLRLLRLTRNGKD